MWWYRVVLAFCRAEIRFRCLQCFFFAFEDQETVHLVRLTIADQSGYSMQVAVWADLARGILKRGLVGMVVALKGVKVSFNGEYGSSGSMNAEGYIIFDDASREDFAQVQQFPPRNSYGECVIE